MGCFPPLGANEGPTGYHQRPLNRRSRPFEHPQRLRGRRIHAATAAAQLEYGPAPRLVMARSEEHTSELQSHLNIVFRLLLEKKKKCARDTHDDCTYKHPLSQ